MRVPHICEYFCLNCYKPRWWSSSVLYHLISRLAEHLLLSGRISQTPRLKPETRQSVYYYYYFENISPTGSVVCIENMSLNQFIAIRMFFDVESKGSPPEIRSREELFSIQLIQRDRQTLQRWIYILKLNLRDHMIWGRWREEVRYWYIISRSKKSECTL